MAHQVTGDEDLVDEVNDPVHTHDVTHDHFGFLIESDAILRERGPAEACTATALAREGPGKLLATTTVPSNDRKSDILTSGTAKGITSFTVIFILWPDKDVRNSWPSRSLESNFWQPTMW